MTRTSGWKAWIAAELRALATVQRSDRPWQMPLAGALAIGLPLLAGAWQQGHLQDAMLASIGGLVFLYVPNTPMSHRMVTLMTCAFAMTTCFALGLLIALAPVGATLVIAAIAVIVNMVCRFYGVGPPGSLFFVMAPMVALTLPPDVGALPERVGVMALGAASACLIAFLYSLHAIRLQPPAPVVPPAPTFDLVVLDSVVIGAFVALAFVLAQALRLDKAYWVAVSCLAVIQGQTLRAVWTKQLHRVLGTALGLAIAAVLFQLPLDAWRIAGLVMVLAFVIEVTVVRHYGFAVAFITPLTILLAEAPTLGHMPVGSLIHARFLDTVLGCAVGLLGGWCLHHPRLRVRVGGWLRALVPRRFEHPQD